VVASARIKDLGAESDRVKSLYAELTAARAAAGEKPLAYDRFSAVVQAQMKKLGEGGREVAFRVAVKDGKVTLTANREDES
jgi:hypothetical protein